MNQYVFVLNKQGERIATLVDNLVSKDELMSQAKMQFPNASYVYSSNGDNMLDDFMSGKLKHLLKQSK